MLTTAVILATSLALGQASLPLPSTAADPGMAAYLTRCWDGYHRALRFREEQMPVMDTTNQIIVFQVLCIMYGRCDL